ncbi:MAG: RNA polymerase Rpb4 family protein [Methanobacteriaceae archaeon]|nr:RNA polymerase Rpb4 family protein [Methanobacteriaceae archaeon]
MIGKNIIDSKPITISEAKEILDEKIQEKVKEDGQLDDHVFTYEQNLTIDYVTKFAKLSSDEAKELTKKLEELITLPQAIKIVDIMPEDIQDLRLIFSKERGTIEKETLEEVLNLVDQYR